MLQMQQQSVQPKFRGSYEQEPIMHGRETSQYSMFPRARPMSIAQAAPMNPLPAYGDAFAHIKQFMASNASELAKQQYMISYITPRVDSMIPP